MMLMKLAYNNIKKTYHIYLVYLFTLCLTIALFYGFTAIGSSDAVKIISDSNKDYTKIFISVVNMTSYFVSFFVLFLMIYASNFFFKVRSQEYFIYKTLGSNNRDLLKLMLGENLIIGGMSLVIGLLLGVGINQLLNQVLVNYLELDKTFALNFDFLAASKTAIYFGIILVIVSFVNARRVKKKSLIELKKVQNEVNKKQLSPVKSIIIISLSILSLTISYTCGFFSLMDPTRPEFYVSIIFGSLGTYLFYGGLVNFKNTKFKNKKVKNKAFENGLLNNRLMKNKLSLSLVSVSFVIILTTIFASNALIGLYSNKEAIPDYDAIIYSSNSETKNFDELRADGYNFNDSAEVYNYNLDLDINGSLYSVMTITESDFIELSKLENKHVKLEGDYNYFEGNDYTSYTDDGSEVKVNNSDLIKYIASEKKLKVNSLENSTAKKYSSGGLLVIKDRKLSEFRELFGDSFMDYGLSWYINYASKDEEKLAIKLEDKQNEARKEKVIIDAPYYINTKATTLKLSLLVQISILFISLYISFFIIIIALAVLAIQQVMDAIEAQSEYKKIRLLGYNSGDIRKVIRRNTHIYFAYPLILGLVNSIAALAVVNNFVYSQMGENIFALKYNQNTLPICVILIIIYVVYIQLVKNIYYRIVEV